MKKIILLTVLFAFMSAFKAEAKTPVDFQFGIFYSSLAPYGSWVELEPGFTVWQPAGRHGWAPYRSGQWIWTDYGWYWDSYEPYGYITYHYGRWYFDDYYGWIWVPDYEWAPAWVEWRYDNDYIGWAPLPPYATFSINIGIVFTNSYHTPYAYWQYVDYGHFCDPNPYNYYIPEKYKYRVHSHGKYRSDYSFRNGGVYNRGVDVQYVSERSGRNINERGLLRVNNENELRNKGGRNDDQIRTFTVSRDELRKSNDGLKDIKIERSDRKTSLLTSKVEIGERTKRDNNSGKQELRTSGKQELRTSGKKNESGLEKRKTNEDTRLINRTNEKNKQKDFSDANKNDVQTRISRDNTKQTTELKKNDVRRPDGNTFRTQTEQKKQKTEMNTRNNDFQKKKNNQDVNKDVNRQFTDNKKQVDVQKNNERKQRTETVNRNDKREEVKRTPGNTKDNDTEKSGRDKGKTKQR